MAKKAAKNLEVDGTAKLAAKSKPGDKHDKPSLTVEEATVASPRPSRKRTGDFNDFEEEEAADATADATAGAPKKIKKAKTDKPNKKAKTESAGKATKATKKNKAEQDAVAEEDTVTARVKADDEKSIKAKKGKKAEPAKEDVVIGPSGDTAEVDAPVSKKASKKEKKAGKMEKDATAGTSEPITEVNAAAPKKTQKKEKKTSKGEKEPAVAAPEDAAEVEEPVQKKAAKKDKKARKHDTAEEDVVVGSSGDTAEVEPTASKAPKKGKKAGKDAPAAAVADPDEAKNIVKPKGAKSSKNTKASDDKPQDKAENADAPSATKGKQSKAKDQDSKKKPAEKAEKPSKSKTPKNSKADGDKVAKAAKPKKEKAAAKGPLDEAKGKASDAANAVQAPLKDAVRKVASPSDTNSTEAPPKSKKRKVSATTDPETVKSNILDPLSEHASASKKQKKDSRKSVGESFGDLVNTGLEAAAQGANTLKQSFGGLIGDAQETLTDSAPEVASTLSKSKGAAKAAKEKGKGKAKAVTLADDLAIADAADDETNDASDSEVDDQTAALLKGFESDGDDEPAGEGAGYKENDKIPDLPDTKKTKKQLKAIKPSGETGVVYLGRVPHGFYEHQIRAYFGQFGDIKRVRVSRARKSGGSKHYAFIEFEDLEVAKIVAGTMDHYLLFGHILKCKLVPNENQHESLWKGADKRFKKVPWNKIEGRKLDMPKSKSEWTKKIEGEEKKREKKAKKLKEIGYEFEAPKLKGVDELKKLEAPVETTETETSLVTASTAGEGVIISEEVKTKKVKTTDSMEVLTGKVEMKAKRVLEDGAETATKTAKKAKRSAEQAVS